MKKSIPLKEIVGFLPYGLKGYFNDNKCVVTEIDIEHEIISSLNYGSVELKNFKPILRNLSDLTKEITHNGETFVPLMRLFGGDDYTKYKYKIDIVEKRFIGQIVYISVEGIGEKIISFSLKNTLSNSLNNINWQKLHEWHFDIFNWIKDGLAIDVNTI